MKVDISREFFKVIGQFFHKNLIPFTRTELNKIINFPLNRRYSQFRRRMNFLVRKYYKIHLGEFFIEIFYKTCRYLLQNFEMEYYWLSRAKLEFLHVDKKKTREIKREITFCLIRISIHFSFLRRACKYRKYFYHRGIIFFTN